MIGFASCSWRSAPGFVAAGRRLLRSAGEERGDDRGARSARSRRSWSAAGIDWMWELTVVRVVGIACLALLVGRGHGGAR